MSHPHFYLKDKNMLVHHNVNLSEKSKQDIMMVKSASTLDAYESDWNDFCDWCGHHELQPFPAEPETIVNYIVELSDNAKVNTISRRVSALSENFIAGGIYDNNPCKHLLVKNALKGIKIKLGIRSHGKEPILLDDIRDMLQHITGSPLLQARNAAILLIGFMGAFRRSEIANLDYDDLRFSRLGLLIHLRKTKTNQQGEEETVGIPYVTDESVCAVRALKHWLELSGITVGPIFRGFTKSGNIRKNRISDKTIALIVKQYAAAIGMNPKDYGAHSLRHGFATTAAQNDVEERDIMRQTRHKSTTMVRRYIDEADKLVHNPLSKMVK
jgi:integrase